MMTTTVFVMSPMRYAHSLPQAVHTKAEAGVGFVCPVFLCQVLFPPFYSQPPSRIHDIVGARWINKWLPSFVCWSEDRTS